MCSPNIYSKYNLFLFLFEYTKTKACEFEKKKHPNKTATKQIHIYVCCTTKYLTVLLCVSNSAAQIITVVSVMQKYLHVYVFSFSVVVVFFND